MTFDVRALTAQDQKQAWDLGSLAFGYHDRPMPEGWVSDSPGRYTLGAFDEGGRLVAKAVDRVQEQWFGGRLVPTSGVAGVVTAPELRGRGLGRLVLTGLLAYARERGAVISTLFDTTPLPYRALGWEEVGSLDYHAFPTRVLASVRPDPAVTLRPAVAADVPAIQEIYRRAARTSTGLMERSGPLYTGGPAEFLAEYNGVTVAVSASGAVEGYASWDRGPGYDSDGKLTVDDLIGLTSGATATLLAMLGGWASVAPTTIIRLGAADPARSLLAKVDGKVESSQPWMLRVVDAPGAVAARGWSRYISGEADLELVDAECPWNVGAYRLVLDKGEARLEPGGTGAARLTPRGLAAWYAGAATPDQLRRSGHLTGGTPDTDAFLQTATAGPIPTLHDYF
ncbi:GNAT family N-acetyltransferase [Catellatospora tritici]|uniref:GNAT family N-acetyltransferase n=1 Tax=Catellatospora tritici TaxID=2851566 RepID=UPI001C2DC693|nr:GNAT family N-acetyltransferase [Catellatospora tritici]MBV1856164.1 GNAT family N-acetyltransferase [Catellatospora tritici]